VPARRVLELFHDVADVARNQRRDGMSRGSTTTPIRTT
jgi:hypothetical protein